jgi:Holliday junction resolvase
VTNYTRGRALEHEVRAALRTDGFEVIRSAGSKSKVDLVAFKVGMVALIQCKRDGKCPPAERAELVRLAALIGAVPLVASRPPRKPIAYRRLTGIGPRDHEPWSSDEIGSTTTDTTGAL